MAQKKLASKIVSILKSKKFFYLIVGLLVIQAGWMAFTASYPMAFDESFHLGIIQIYAQQWSPILTHTPAHSAQFGELTHDPSYMYHYLMSFPYRIIHFFVHNFVAEVIIMRFLDIGLFVGGLFGFRKLLIRMGASQALTHFSLLMLVSLPVTPFLAAHINYDNMLFLLLPINVMFTLDCIDSITKKNTLSAKTIVKYLALGMMTCLVKYVFLPIFFIATLYIVGIWIYNNKRRDVLKSVWFSFTTLSLYVKIGLVVTLIISSGLFLQRYAVNLVEYHDIQPDCTKVESLNDCLQYGPWARNYYLEAQASLPGATLNPTETLFLPNWVGGLIYRLYFAINYDFHEYAPMPLPIAMAYVIGIIGLILSFVFWRSIFRVNRHIWLLIAITVAYALSLLYVNFTEYLRFDKMVAINGRYFIPLLPFIFLIIGLAYRRFLSVVAGNRVVFAKGALSLATILIASQGGGILTYLIHSDAVWYWKGDPLTSFNLEAKKIVTPLVIGAKK